MAENSYSPIITSTGLKTYWENGLAITHISFGKTKYNPTENDTAHTGMVLKTTISEKSILDKNTAKIRANVKAESGKSFTCFSIGFWAGDTLFAVYSNKSISSSGLFTIHDNVTTTVSYSLNLTNLDTDHLTINIDQSTDRALTFLQEHEQNENPHPQYLQAINALKEDLNANVKLLNSQIDKKYTEKSASVKQAGTVKLNNTLNSTSVAEALTAAQGKELAEQIANVSAASADGKVSKTGDTVTGYLNIKMTNGYSGINQYNDAGKHTRIETIPDSVDHIGFYKISQRTDSEEIHSVAFPKSGKNKIVAYQDWATAEINQVKTIATTAQTAANTAQNTANGKWTAVDATTGRKGIVQLSSATNSTAENLAATPKAVKDAYSLASVAASNAATAQSTANGKWTAVDATTGRKGIVQLSSATNSTAENLAATSKAVKTAYDLAVTANTTASGKWTAVDASTTAKGIVQLNNTLTSTSTTQALTAAQGKKLQDEKAPINNPTFTGTLKTDYRLSIEREHAEYAPYLQTIDLSQDFANAAPSTVKSIGDLIFKIKKGSSEQNLGLISTEYNLDKSGVFRAAAYSSQGNANWLFAGFGETGNVVFGKRSDDGTNRVQINGTATVSAPAANANNAQVPTTSWVRQQNYFKSTGGTLTGNLAINSGNDYSSLSQYNTANKHTRAETLPDSNTNFYKISYWNESGAETDAAFFPKSGKQKIVAYQDWTNAEINKVKTIATTAQSIANAKWTAVDANTGRKGIVQLNSAISSASEAMAATSLAVKTAYDRASTAISTANSKSTVAILTGEIRHGGTIPLPSGFTQAQCKWFVSIKNSNPNNSLWDIKESGSWEHFRLECYADNNRKVTAIQYRHDEGRDTTHNMTANYIIIGVK